MFGLRISAGASSGAGDGASASGRGGRRGPVPQSSYREFPLAFAVVPDAAAVHVLSENPDADVAIC